MSFFEETKQPKINDHGLWAEKYRPRDLSTYIADDAFKKILQSYIDKKEIPHILLYGPAGTGKTSIAKILTSNIQCDCLYVNASDNTGVDFIREKIRPFAASSGFNDLKIVILDESDFLSVHAMSSLRNMMETFSKTTRFILTCNYVEKIISPLISRCQVYEVTPPTKKDVAVYLKHILDSEQITYEMLDLKKIVEDYYPDVRKIINYAQQTSSEGKIVHIKKQSATHNLQNQIVDLLIQKKKGTFNEIRQLISDSGIKMFEELYKTLFDNLDKYGENKKVEITLTIAEYSYQNAMVVDKEITFMACIASILKILK